MEKKDIWKVYFDGEKIGYHYTKKDADEQCRALGYINPHEDITPYDNGTTIHSFYLQSSDVPHWFYTDRGDYVQICCAIGEPNENEEQDYIGYSISSDSFEYNGKEDGDFVSLDQIEYAIPFKLYLDIHCLFEETRKQLTGFEFSNCFRMKELKEHIEYDEKPLTLEQKEDVLYDAIQKAESMMLKSKATWIKFKKNE